MACIRKRRGRWVIDFYDQHGKRRWKTLKKGTTKKAARGELRAIEDEVSKGAYLPKREIPTFSEVAKEWLEYKKPKIRASTWGEYERHTKIHFGELKDLKISRVTIATIEKFITKCQEKHKNLSTVRRILVTLNQIMSYAIRHRYTDHNPVRDAERPRRTNHDLRESEKKDAKVKVLNATQVNALLEATEGQKFRMLFRLAIFSGARQGELLGLKWIDIDWQNKQIHIQRTFNHGTFFPPKSETSNRKIDIGPTTMTELKKWRLACPKNDLNLVFPSETGTPIDHHHMVSRVFGPALTKASLPNIRFHDLRHTYASLLIGQGENIKYIQSQLGHSSPTVTLDIYAHLMKPTNQEAACRLEKAVFEGNGCKTVATTGAGDLAATGEGQQASKNIVVNMVPPA